MKINNGITQKEGEKKTKQYTYFAKFYQKSLCVLKLRRITEVVAMFPMLILTGPRSLCVLKRFSY